ncbi:type IV pilus modification PilV family protein [Roseateles sp. NT4]|uniref:type IV pilus modification PilV family protein n=1 Tax=Roseateles sp. NT4 TaxID=3453715 RepID=UPI003EED7BCA
MLQTLPVLPSRLAPRLQRGVTLVEALIALLVMSFGMLALVGLMSHLRLGADVARQRSEAMRIAQAAMATARNFSVLNITATTPASAVAYALLTSQAPVPVTPPDANTTYTVQRTVTPVAGVQAMQVRVNVSWADRSGGPQFINLDTIIAGVDPLFSGAVGFAPPAAAVTLPSARSPAVPAGAKQLDDKISAFRPSGLGPVVWIFNNLSGAITGKCTIPAGTPVSALTAADVESCKNNTVGYLLSGSIRFSRTNPASPTAPEAAAIPVGLSLVDGSYFLPRLDAQGMPVMNGGGMVLDGFTATAPAGAHLPDCFSGSPGGPAGAQFVNYHCIVYPPDTAASGSRPTWSGKLVLTGVSLGTTSAEYRVCRYSADYNASGGIYTADWKALENEEHPAVYARVAGSLTHQNFLVVRGDVGCPPAPAASPGAGVFADYSTLQLQP